MAEIVVSEFIDGEVLAALRRDFDVIADPALAGDSERLTGQLVDARALIVRNRTIVDGRLLGHAPKLEAIGRLGVGLDNIDVAACEARGIAICPAIGANAPSVAEYVIAVALMLLRPVYRATPEVIAGVWPREKLSLGREARGQTIGLIGFGAIAQAVASRARGLEMTIIAHDPAVPGDDPRWRLAGRVGLDEIIARADILSLHVPLSPDTRNMIGRKQIARMKPGAILINTARGGIVDEDAVVAALRSGHLSGAALDVFENEPLSADAAARFSGVANLVLTPHIAGITRQSNRRVSEITVAGVRAVLERREK